MSSRPRRRAVVLLATALLLTACHRRTDSCSPTTVGLGDQRRLERRDLPGRDPKEPCHPHVEVFRNAKDLTVAYEAAGVHIIGTSAPQEDAIQLPMVDFDAESVIVREELHDHPASWIVASGDTVTIGSQGCAGGGDGICAVEVFAVDAIVTKVSTHVCEPVACEGS